MSIIKIENNLGVAKYKQIIISIEKALIDKVLKKGDRLPSINSIRNKYEVSRDTVLMAYSELKTRGIVQSISGKGYFVKNENIDTAQKVFLLFDELNVFKEDLYNSFLKNLPTNIQVDIYFHHFNYDIFTKLIYDNIGNYNSYIIMPANLKNTKNVIEKLPSEKVYILDQTNKELADYQSIYQNFEKDIYNNLFDALPLIKNYKKITLLFQDKKQPLGILKGFTQFCKKNKINSNVIETIENLTPAKNEAYIIPDDRNLILLIKKIREENLSIGSEIGIIAINDSLLKEILDGGITTMTTNFTEMGKKLAQMLTNKEQLKIQNPINLITRNSL
jgi:DNA-binding transcriptional regulator YhcF (GntR family)